MGVDERRGVEIDRTGTLTFNVVPYLRHFTIEVANLRRNLETIPSAGLPEPYTKVANAIASGGSVASTTASDIWPSDWKDRLPPK
jgi:hypothetical protein